MTSLRGKRHPNWRRLSFALVAALGAATVGCSKTVSTPPPPAAAPALEMPDIGPLLKSASSPVPGATQHTATVIGKHTMTTATDVPAGVTGNDDAITVTFGAHKIVFDFAREQIILDDTEPRKLPEGAKQVDFQYVGGKLKISTDGQPVSLPDSPQ